MDINLLKDLFIDWDQVDTTRTNGLNGYADIKQISLADINIRRVTYTSGYEADHWCQKGHIIQVLKGELIIVYDNNVQKKALVGSTIILGDGQVPHKARTIEETVVLIID